MRQQLSSLIFLHALVLFAGAMLGPLYAINVLRVGGGSLAAATAWAVFCAVAGVVALLLGAIEDRLKESERAIALGLFITAVGYVGYTLVENVAGILVVQALLGFGMAVATPAFGMLFTHALTRRRAAQEWSRWLGITSIAGAVGALLGAFVVDISGFGTLFLLMAFVAFVSSIMVLSGSRRLVLS